MEINVNDLAGVILDSSTIANIKSLDIYRKKKDENDCIPLVDYPHKIIVNGIYTNTENVSVRVLMMAYSEPSDIISMNNTPSNNTYLNNTPMNVIFMVLHTGKIVVMSSEKFTEKVEWTDGLVRPRYIPDYPFQPFKYGEKQLIRDTIREVMGTAEGKFIRFCGDSLKYY